MWKGHRRSSAEGADLEQDSAEQDPLDRKLRNTNTECAVFRHAKSAKIYMAEHKSRLGYVHTPTSGRFFFSRAFTFQY